MEKSLADCKLANSVTLSTRVRINILKAMAKKLMNEKAYTFIDAVIRFGGALTRTDLDEAYRRAGGAFRGQVEQHFVVLREGNPFVGSQPTGGKPRAGKRRREDEKMKK
jgi:hypothetical protein